MASTVAGAGDDEDAGAEDLPTEAPVAEEAAGEASTETEDAAGEASTETEESVAEADALVESTDEEQA